MEKVRAELALSISAREFCQSVTIPLFFQMIDDYVGVEQSPTEKEQKWREVTR